MRVLIVGATGQLGSDLVREYSDVEVSCASRRGSEFAIDLAAPEIVRKAILDEIRPELVINAAAVHNVSYSKRIRGRLML